MNRDFIYDIETYPNTFTLSAAHTESGQTYSFSVSPWTNDAANLMQFIEYLRANNCRMVGFNNLGFDYPIVHLFYRTGGSATPKTLYEKAQAIIASHETDRWIHEVKVSDMVVPQIDLFRIHHFDNVARATSLKVIEFNMRRKRVMDNPLPIGRVLQDFSELLILLDYNREDVDATRAFYKETLPMIRFREELTAKYSRDFMNHNDTKIGKDYFIMRLEQAGVSCYDYSPQLGRSPRQTKRRSLKLIDAILPSIRFDHPEFNRVLGFLKSQEISETKGVFKDISASVNGFRFDFGTGGIHGSVENKHVRADEDYAIIDLDVSSYYPNLAIQNQFYPDHLGPAFCLVYRDLYEQRKQYPKGSAENAMLKLALNGVYGDSNNKFSVFYDPLFTMKITLNGQLLLCMLAEKLMSVPGIQMIQINTDGMTVRVPRTQTQELNGWCQWWEEMTGLVLEETRYSDMWVLDVNNYIAQGENGKVKRKGRYEYDLEWHQNHGALVVPKVAERVLIEGAPIRETVMSWHDTMDFMMRTKVPRSSYLALEVNGKEHQIPNVSRYCVTKGGGKLFKWMPPLKDNPNWRRIGVNAGWTVEVCNELGGNPIAIDHDFYVREIEKLTLGVM